MSRDAPSLYESVLARLPLWRPAALPPPRASAAVVMWRRPPEAGSAGEGDGPRTGDARAGLEVYWIERAEALPFMGGWHAFPGGGLARADAALPVTGAVASPVNPLAIK